MMKVRLLIYGLGLNYNNTVNALHYFEMRGDIEILAVTDKKLPDGSKFDGYDLITREEAIKIDYNYIVITSDRFFHEIVNELEEMGIDKEKILPARIFLLPNLNFQKYIELKNSKPTIISNTCWGGIVYRKLGLECRSPFKNLFLRNNEYIKLINNFEYYMHCELEFTGQTLWEVDLKWDFPIMRLDDVNVYCNHYHTPEEAKKKWNERRAKINYSNLIAEMGVESREIAEQFLKFSPNIKRKICLVPFKQTHQDMYHLERRPGQTEFWQTVNASGDNTEYNLVEWLLGNNAARNTM